VPPTSGSKTIVKVRGLSMTKRELVLYMLAGCVLWALTYWRWIVAAGVVAVVLVIVGR